MSEIYFTIAGTNHWHGQEFIEPQMKVKSVVKFKAQMKKLTCRSWGVGNAYKVQQLNQLTRHFQKNKNGVLTWISGIWYIYFRKSTETEKI